MKGKLIKVTPSEIPNVTYLQNPVLYDITAYSLVRFNTLPLFCTRLAVLAVFAVCFMLRPSFTY
jgi:hypothetical protein